MTHERAREIFTGAVKLPGGELAAFLEEACGGDAALRAAVDAMIKNDPGPDATLEADAQPRPTPGLYHKGDTIDAYTIQRRIGRGGMGAVYLATQTEPIKRSVALKFILSGEPSEEVIARFEQEKQTLVNMNHPGIAKVFDAGTTPVGYPYFVMEYIEGEELDTFCDRNKLNTTERLQLFAKICDAVQHAQQKGFIHRDLKPGNILVVSSDEGEPQPKVIDFGIAKATSVDDQDDQPMLSRHGQLIGTYEYMSPEQAEGLSDIDIRSDVYALGVILYELLSGRRPFDLKNRAHAELLRVIREDDPPKPSSRLSSIEGDDGTKIADDRKTKQSELASTLRKELDWIPLKALRKDREERYDSAAAMGKDVRRYLAHEALEAGPESARYRLKKLVRRHKVPFIAAALVAVALVAGIISTSIFAVRAEEQRKIAEAETKEAQQQRDVALEQAYFGNLHAAEAALNLGNMTSVHMRLANAREAKETQIRIRLSLGGEHDQKEEGFGSGGSLDHLPFEWQYLNARSDDSFATLRGHENYVYSIAFSPDGTRLASGSRDFSLRLWDVETGEELAKLRGHECPVNAVAFNHNGTRLASGGWNNTVRLWDVETGKELATLRGHEEGVSSVAFSPDGARLASGSDDTTIRLWDTETGEELATLLGHEGGVGSVAFSPDGTRLASAGYDKTIRLWDVETGEELATWHGHEGGVKAVAFSRDGTCLASGVQDKTIRLWDAETGKEIAILRGHEGDVVSVAFSPDGTRLASGSYDKTIRLWDVESGEEVAIMRGHLSAVLLVAFNSDGTRLASSATNTYRRDIRIRLWDIATDEELVTIQGHGGRGVRSVAFSPDGTRLALGSYDDNVVSLWDVETGEELAILRGHEEWVLSVAFSPDGTRLASGSWDDTIRLWDLQTGEELATLRGHEGDVVSVAFSPDGTRLASGSLDQTVRLWDLQTGEELATLRGHESRVRSVAFSPNGTRLASCNGTIYLWDIETGEEVATMGGGQSDVVFSPDGTRLASVGFDNHIRVWDAETGEEIATLRGHESVVWSVAFSPDGTRLASGSNDKTIRLWDAGTGEELTTLRGHEGGVYSVAFSPDGTRLVSAEDQNIRLWETRSHTQLLNDLRLARARAAELEPLVIEWVDDDNKKTDDRVLARLEEEIKSRSPEETATLRNLVLKHLTVRRQARQAQTAEPTEAAQP